MLVRKFVSKLGNMPTMEELVCGSMNKMENGPMKGVMKLISLKNLWNTL